MRYISTSNLSWSRIFCLILVENTGGEGTVCWENRREMREKIGSSFVRNLAEIVGDKKVEGDMVSVVLLEGWGGAVNYIHNYT